jgi:hypothetical protein
LANETRERPDPVFTMTFDSLKKDANETKGTRLYYSVFQPVVRNTQMCRQFFLGLPTNNKISQKVCKNNHIFIIVVSFIHAEVTHVAGSLEPVRIVRLSPNVIVSNKRDDAMTKFNITFIS